MTGAGFDESLLSGPRQLSLPERSLLDLRIRTHMMSDKQYTTARELYGGKGISHELGHVDQLGDWDAGKALDAQIRQLPVSSALDAAGFDFQNNYDSKESAKLSYSFNVTGSLGRALLFAKRKRAAADIQAGDGSDVFEVVKVSTFLVSPELMTGSERKMIDGIMKLGSEQKKKASGDDAFDHAVQAAGEHLIEPVIRDPEIRKQRAAIIAASSLYFALFRHQESADLVLDDGDGAHGT
jgi:hypothetical protein